MMKKRCWLLFAIALLSCKTQPDAIRKLTRDKQVSPPGTVWLKDSIYMDQTEISNLDYRKYTHWIHKYEPQNYDAALPDTTVWHDKFSYNEPYVKYYFQHPAYNNYPVVGVSYEQASAFCRWRTERVKEYCKKNEKKYSKFQNIAYRLPTKEEWEYAAFAGLYSNSIFGFEKIIAKDNYPKAWVKEASLFYYYEGGDLTRPVKFNFPNKYSLYNMIGNVAEMVSDKGVSKGGSIFDALHDCEIKKMKPYTKPSAWLGFRSVCEIH